MILHEYYFGNLRAAANPKPPAGSGLTEALVGSFGSADRWRTDFQAIGEMRGVGWVILFQDPVTDRLTNHWITLHQDGVPAGFKPLLVMDVWEHAFMRDYKATERDQYIEAFFRNIDWSDRRDQAPGRAAPCGPQPEHPPRCPLRPSRCRRGDTVTEARALTDPELARLSSSRASHRGPTRSARDLPLTRTRPAARGRRRENRRREE